MHPYSYVLVKLWHLYCFLFHTLKINVWVCILITTWYYIVADIRFCWLINKYPPTVLWYKYQCLCAPSQLGLCRWQNSIKKQELKLQSSNPTKGRVSSFSVILHLDLWFVSFKILEWSELNTQSSEGFATLSSMVTPKVNLL